MRISIFSPTHDSKYLLDVYESIKDQDFYEWVILYNNGAKFVEFNDDRVVNVKSDIQNGECKIGRLKREACGICRGDILLELDHDDLLTPDAIECVKDAFKKPNVGFVYSNSLITDMELGKRPRYDSKHGWVYREKEFRGKLLDEPICFEATPASVSKIWYAPDHLRSFRKSVYESVGGYNPDLPVLDDQDLMCRLYLATDFYHIDKGLYVYRVHTDNSWLRHNQEIQKGVWPLYDYYIEKMALKWSACSGLKSYDLGGRLQSYPDYISVDLKDADVIADLNERWPMEDSSVGVIRAYDVFEHLRDPLKTMKELYRVLAPGGYAFIQVPSTDGRGAFQDPTHVSFWNDNSWLYYSDRDYAKYIDSPVRFQVMRGYTTGMNDRGVCWSVAHLVNLKGGVKIPGVINI
jgi:hypothetical protein